MDTNQELQKPEEPIEEEIRSITVAISSSTHEAPETASVNQATADFLQETKKVLGTRLGIPAPGLAKV